LIHSPYSDIQKRVTFVHELRFGRLFAQGSLLGLARTRLRARSSRQHIDNSVLTGDLALAILRREVGDATAAVQWLDANRARVPVD
jgi:hypothetical protein